MWTYLGVWSHTVWLSFQAFMGMVFHEYSGGPAHDAPIYGDVILLQRDMGII
jgi:hypothetical protein